MILLTSRQLAVNQPIVSMRMPLRRSIVEAFLLSVDSPTISAHGREANKETHAWPELGADESRQDSRPALTPTELQAAAPHARWPTCIEPSSKMAARSFRCIASLTEVTGSCLAALPIELVEPTPYQRNLSDTHVRKLEAVIGKIAPVSRSDHFAYASPRKIRRRSIGHRTAIIGSPPCAHWERRALWRSSCPKPQPPTTFSLSIPRKPIISGKRHSRLFACTRNSCNSRKRTEETYALEFEEPALITLGLCYEERPRFSGGAYHPVLKRVEEFLKKPMRTAFESRQERARKLLGLDDAIVKQVECAQGERADQSLPEKLCRRPRESAPFSAEGCSPCLLSTKPWNA